MSGADSVEPTIASTAALLRRLDRLATAASQLGDTIGMRPLSPDERLRLGSALDRLEASIVQAGHAAGVSRTGGAS